MIGLLLLLLVAAAVAVIWCWVFSLAVAEEKADDKIVWSLVVFFGGPLGALMYLLIRVPVLKREERERDSELLRQMREDFGKSQPAAAKP